MLEDLLGDGIFNSNGEAWRVQRKAASHEFSVSRFRDFMSEVFVNHTCTLVEHIGNLVGGSAEGVATAVDMQKLFSKYTLQSIGEIGFGVDLECLRADAQVDVPFESAFDTATAGIIDRFMNPFWPLLRRFNLGSEKKMSASLKIIKDFADKVRPPPCMP